LRQWEESPFGEGKKKKNGQKGKKRCKTGTCSAEVQDHLLCTGMGERGGEFLLGKKGPRNEKKRSRGERTKIMNDTGASKGAPI